MKGSEGYLKAKRQVVAYLDFLISKYDLSELLLKGYSEEDRGLIRGKQDTLEEVRNYVRNHMLWKIEDGE